MTRVPEDIKRGLLSKEERARIGELGDEGLTAAQIARRLNRHPGTVSYAMHREGVRKLTRRTFCFMRNGVLVKSFSEDEDEFITERRIAGETTTAIAKAVTERFGHPRSPHTINMRLVCLTNAEEAA